MRGKHALVIRCMERVGPAMAVADIAGTLHTCVTATFVTHNGRIDMLVFTNAFSFTLAAILTLGLFMTGSPGAWLGFSIVIVNLCSMVQAMGSKHRFDL